MSQGYPIPYNRTLSEQPFREAKRLDVSALQSMWLPWITLESDPASHLLALNASLTWHQSRKRDAADTLSRPWFSTYAAGGLRPWVLGQARAADQIGSDVELSPAMAELRETWHEELHGASPLRRLQATAVLGSLTASLPLLEAPRPNPESPDPLEQHYCYEHSRVVRQRDLHHEPSVSALRILSNKATEPALRLLVTVSFAGHVLRKESDFVRVDEELARAERMLGQLDVHEPWLAALVTSRFHRMKALRSWRMEERDTTLLDLRSTRDADKALAAEAEKSGDELIRHLWQENHRLLLEVTVKNQVGHDPDEIADVIAEIDKIEPHYAESQYYIGEVFAQAGRLSEAADHFVRSAQGGEARGAVGAFRAYECQRELGDRESAIECLDLLEDLDPAADAQAYRTELN
ncbi:hypothetical protein OHA84_35985 [Streptomyces sp. NBC_00513]|uniref:tetratricopeptide repeat protein n=1 Tax=unclassified Streptomyces TaxID=2593676 RepID=UPI002255672A|nr:hypothetical protein [Streptomyces sp. NBC_00424]MCX5071096.1 hypothetical protein [Streptomyces sp. NBC_00424]WUD45480.1 hypothetical protein OHA84_35985 [Streptomyces sp. NBC_00513]